MKRSSKPLQNLSKKQSLQKDTEFADSLNTLIPSIQALEDKLTFMITRLECLPSPDDSPLLIVTDALDVLYALPLSESLFKKHRS